MANPQFCFDHTLLAPKPAASEHLSLCLFLKPLLQYLSFSLEVLFSSGGGGGGASQDVSAPSWAEANLITSCLSSPGFDHQERWCNLLYLLLSLSLSLPSCSPSPVAADSRCTCLSVLISNVFDDPRAKTQAKKSRGRRRRRRRNTGLWRCWSQHTSAWTSEGLQLSLTLLSVERIWVESHREKKKIKNVDFRGRHHGKSEWGNLSQQTEKRNSLRLTGPWKSILETWAPRAPQPSPPHSHKRNI